MKPKATIIMATKIKKLLYQLEQDLACSFDGIFTPSECEQFDREVGDGISLLDTQGRKVVTFQKPRTIIVARGYRWDGCSPKLHCIDLFWVGTPDGIIIGSERPFTGPDQDRDIPITHERVTHLASVVHDVLGYCKYDTSMPSLFRAPNKPQLELWGSNGRRNRDHLFFELLKRKDHWIVLAWIYYTSVRILGPLYDLFFGITSGEQGNSV